MGWGGGDRERFLEGSFTRGNIELGDMKMMERRKRIRERLWR